MGWGLPRLAEHTEKDGVVRGSSSQACLDFFKIPRSLILALLQAPSLCFFFVSSGPVLSFRLHDPDPALTPLLGEQGDWVY